MAFSLKKWIGSQLFSAFMAEYNENLEEIEDQFIATEVISGTDGTERWTKWPDGTMMVTRYKIRLTRHSGGTYFLVEWTPSQEFYDIPNISAVISNANADWDNSNVDRIKNSSFRISTVDATADTLQLRIVTGDGTFSGDWVDLFCITAIGRWKE